MCVKGKQVLGHFNQLIERLKSTLVRQSVKQNDNDIDNAAILAISHR